MSCHRKTTVHWCTVTAPLPKWHHAATSPDIMTSQCTCGGQDDLWPRRSTLKCVRNSTLIRFWRNSKAGLRELVPQGVKNPRQALAGFTCFPFLVKTARVWPNAVVARFTLLYRQNFMRVCVSHAAKAIHRDLGLTNRWMPPITQVYCLSCHKKGTQHWTVPWTVM